MSAATQPSARANRTRRSARLPHVLLALAAATLVAPLVAAQGAPEDAQAVLDKVLANLRGLSQRATLTLAVERPDRASEYTMEVVSDGDQRSLVRVTAPPREAGQAFLSVGNNLLVYNPRLGRSLRLPPSGRSNAFLGSDLSYDDLAGEEYRDQYDASIVSKEPDAITLALTPHPEAPTPYGKLVFEIAPGSYAPRELTFFDQRDTAVKRLSFSEFRTVDGRSVPERFEVADLIKEGYRTVATWTGAEYGIDVPERCFTEAALERGCN